MTPEDRDYRIVTLEIDALTIHIGHRGDQDVVKVTTTLIDHLEAIRSAAVERLETRRTSLAPILEDDGFTRDVYRAVVSGDLSGDMPCYCHATMSGGLPLGHPRGLPGCRYEMLQLGGE
jgi:hypothetical protein